MRVVTFLGCGLAFVASPAAAAGFSLKSQDAETLGAALAGAQAHMASPGAAFYNPASIVGVDGLESSASVIAGILDTSYNSASGVLLGSAPIEGETAGESVVPDLVTIHSGFAAPLTDRLYLGAAINIPFGFSSSYGEDSVARYHGVDSEVFAVSLTPILGVALNENWSLAAGPRIQYFSVDIENAIDAAGIATALEVGAFAPGTQDAFSRLEDEDFDLGFVVGLQGAPTENLRVGASFTSKITHDFDGEATFDIAGSMAAQALSALGLFQNTRFTSELTTPASVQVGAAFDVSPSVTLLASTTLTRWSTFEEIRADFDNPAQPPEIVTQNWRDAWSWSAGAEFNLSPANTARAGIMYEKSPVDPEFATTRIPDGDRIWLGAGFSRELGERATLHLGGAYLLFDDRMIDQPGTRPENLFRGSLEANLEISTLLLSAGLDWRF